MFQPKIATRLAAAFFAASAGLLIMAGLAGSAPAAVMRPAAAPGSSPMTTEPPEGRTVTVSSQDRAFLNTAAQANIAEIAISQNVEMRVAEPLNALAATYVSDHTTALAGLRQLAAGLGTALPATATAAQQAEAAQIESQSGHALAVAFAQASVAAHQQAIALFQQEVSAGSNWKVTSAANAAMPMLNMHLRLAQQDASELGVPVSKMPQGAPATGGGGTSGVQRLGMFIFGSLGLLAGLAILLISRRAAPVPVPGR